MDRPTGGDGRPSVSLLLHLARTGGTLISRCLATMQNVVLLSEIHPDGAAINHPIYDPVDQATRWYGLFDPAEAQARGRTTPEKFVGAIRAIAERSQARGATLVVRDWTHLDFVGAPFRRDTSGKLATLAALSPHFDVRVFATVRHPIPQWLSLRRILGSADLTEERFLAGCRAFAEAIAPIGFVRYEDVAQAPDATLSRLADALGILFDPAYAGKWATYRHITGDAPAAGESDIRPPRKRPLPPGLAARFAASDDYRRTLEILGYEHPG